MQIFQLSSFPIEQVRDLDALERRLGGWFAGLHYPVRLLALSRAFDMRPPMQAVQRDGADLERLRRLCAPLLHAIDGISQGDPVVHPHDVVADMLLDDVGMLLDLFADMPQLQDMLTSGEKTHDQEADRHAWALIGQGNRIKKFADTCGDFHQLDGTI